jgi:DNA repair photolyase
MIISASRRTDIPAFFGKWFMDQLKQGFVEITNPYNPNQIRKILLQPEDVKYIVFWTRNPQPFLKNIPLLHSYSYYFLFTLTPYDQELEPGVPDKKVLIKTFQQLSGMIGNEKLIWRYDPIVFSETMDVDFHLKAFEKTIKALAPYTKKCIISFLTFYRKIIHKLQNRNIRKPAPEEMAVLMETLAAIAHSYNIEIRSCASEIPFEIYGVNPNRCIDNDLISRLTGRLLPYSKDKNQRNACGCHESVDIGTYNTCKYGCLYCYANK